MWTSLALLSLFVYSIRLRLWPKSSCLGYKNDDTHSYRQIFHNFWLTCNSRFLLSGRIHTLLLPILRIHFWTPRGLRMSLSDTSYFCSCVCAWKIHIYTADNSNSRFLQACAVPTIKVEKRWINSAWTNLTANTTIAVAFYALLFLIDMPHKWFLSIWFWMHTVHITPALSSLRLDTLPLRVPILVLALVLY